MKKELNKWQLILSLINHPHRYDIFTKVFTIGVIKLTSFPEEGGRLQKRHHKGFLIEITFWWPIASIENN